MKNKLSLEIVRDKDRFWELVRTITQNNFGRHVLGSYALQIGSVLLSMVSSILLARLLGADGFGEYAYALNWALLLTTFTTLGMDKLAVRSIASYAAKEQWSFIKGFMRWTSIMVLLFSLLIMAIAFAVRGYFVAEFTPSIFFTLTISLFLLPLLALTRVYQGILRGFHLILKGQVAETILRPLLLIFFLLLGYFTIRQMTAPLAMGLHVTAAISGLAIIIYLVICIVKPRTRNLQPAYTGRLWLTIAIPILLSSMLDEINQRASILMLGTLLNTEAVGVYNVAKRLAEPTIFVLIAINVTLAPRIASYYSNNQHEEMQSLVTRSTRAALLLSGLTVLFVISLGPRLFLLWGPEFSAGYPVLIILALGQLVQAAIGPVVILLNMTGYERNVVVGLAISSTLNILLNIVLIPRYGMMGAASATVAGILSWNILLAGRVRKLLRIDPSILGRTIGASHNG